MQMSCKAMGGPISMIASKECLGLLVYGCGPNIVVGAIGAAVTGSIIGIEKVKQVWLEAKIDSADTPTKMKFAQKISELENQRPHKVRLAKAFVVSMIPIVGPFGALIYL
jgi:hypothetical protein